MRVETGSPPYLSAAQLAKQAGVTSRTIRSWSHRELLPGHQVGTRGDWRYPESAIEVARGLASRVPQWKRQRPPENSSSLRDALTTALHRSGLTLKAAATASGLSVSTIHKWLAGRMRPTRDALERLAEVVSEPALTKLTTMSDRQRTRSAHQSIRMVCKCGAVRTVKPGWARKAEKDRGPLLAQRARRHVKVDWDKGEAEYTCRTCATREMGSEYRQDMKRRHGRKGLRVLADPLLAWRQANPDNFRAACEAGKPHQRRQLTAHDKARISLGRLILEPKGSISLCAFCHHLLFMPAWRVGEHHIGKFHGPCLAKWQRTKPYKEWLADCIRARREGKPVPPMPMPERPADRMVTSAELATAYTTTVRYFWQCEGNKRAERDADNQVMSVTWLANELDIPRSALYKRVQRFLDLLPHESIASGTVKTWCAVFLTLRPEAFHDRTELSAQVGSENGGQVAQPTTPSARLS